MKALLESLGDEKVSRYGCDRPSRLPMISAGGKKPMLDNRESVAAVLILA